MDGLLVAKIVLDPKKHDAPLRLANLGDDSLKLQKNTLIATGEPVIVIKSDSEKEIRKRNWLFRKTRLT